MSELEKKALATLKAVKALQYDINREVLDSVAICIILLEATNEKTEVTSGKVAQKAKVEKVIPEKNEEKIPTREELNKIDYWVLRKEYSIKGKKKMNKDDVVEEILSRYNK